MIKKKFTKNYSTWGALYSFIILIRPFCYLFLLFILKKKIFLFVFIHFISFSIYLISFFFFLLFILFFGIFFYLRHFGATLASLQRHFGAIMAFPSFQFFLQKLPFCAISRNLAPFWSTSGFVWHLALVSILSNMCKS